MAAAAVALPSRRPAGRAVKNAPLPSWCDPDSESFIPWLPLPNSYFEKAFRRLTGLENHLLGLISRLTYGDIREGRPEWLTDHSLDRLARLTGAHRNSVALALDRLERAGAIDSEKQGRGKRYRVAVERWDNLKELPPEAEDEQAPDEEELPPEAEDDQVKEPVPVIRMGKHSIPLSSVSFCKECAAKVIAAVTGSSEPTRGKANKKGTIVTVECDDQAVAEAQEPEKANKKGTIVTVECDDQAVAELECYLVNNFAKKLVEAPPPTLLRKAITDLRSAGVPLSDLFARIDLRRGIFRYGLLPNLVVDVINTHAAMRRHSARSPEPATGPSFAEQVRTHVCALIPVYESLAPPIAEVLARINVNAATYEPSQIELEHELQDAEIVAAGLAAATRLSEHRQRLIEAEAVGAIEPRKTKMRPEAYRQELERLRAALILKACGLPRLVFGT
ncbi:MAG: hypothetical protein EPO02_12880 [Nitrospirae bacterium]|nr:MAG: hypothetical protein EPO02_12880 [Nitrospirota bacterium]